MQNAIEATDLVRRLLRSGHTTYSLADEIGVSQPLVSRLATGRTKRASAETFQRLLKLAGGEITLPPEPGAPAEGKQHAA